MTDRTCSWRPQFFGPNSETWFEAAQDMYVGACKVSEFFTKNCNLDQSRRKINGKPLHLPSKPKKASQGARSAVLAFFGDNVSQNIQYIM
jgi:hypothetical protein